LICAKALAAGPEKSDEEGICQADFENDYIYQVSLHPAQPLLYLYFATNNITKKIVSFYMRCVNISDSNYILREIEGTGITSYRL
jgi:hypothetical protein